MDDHTIKVEKYSSALPSDHTEKDRNVSLVNFNEFSSNQFLQDNLSSDPATRFQILKNAFERCLNDALVCNFLDTFSFVGLLFHTFL